MRATPSPGNRARILLAGSRMRRAGPPIVLFHYAPGRGKQHLLKFLGGYRGRFLQCDAMLGLLDPAAVFVHPWAGAVECANRITGLVRGHVALDAGTITAEDLWDRYPGT